MFYVVNGDRFAVPHTFTGRSFALPGWYRGLFDAEKVEQRIPLERVSDIYQYTEQIRETVRRYL